MDINPVSPPEAHYTVYKLTSPAGKVYIGCTGTNVKDRWDSGWGYRHSTLIREDIGTFGWMNFRKEILCEKLTKSGAEKLEKWFVEYYDSMNPEKGYNRMTGGARKGARVSAEAKALNQETKLAYYQRHPEARRRIAMQVSEYLRSPEGRKFVLSSTKAKPVRCVETGEVYLSQNAAEKATGYYGIHKACSGIQQVCGGYHWENI